MDALKQELKSLLISSLNLEDITVDDIADDLPLFSEEGLGLDSVDGLELGLALKKKIWHYIKFRKCRYEAVFPKY